MTRFRRTSRELCRHDDYALGAPATDDAPPLVQVSATSMQTRDYRASLECRAVAESSY